MPAKKKTTDNLPDTGDSAYVSPDIAAALAGKRVIFDKNLSEDQETTEE